MAYLQIPSIRLHQVVVEGISSGDLMQGPGHRPDSAWPGQPGVSVIAGKRATFGGPFAELAHIPLGAPILVTTGQGRVTYTVSDIRRSDQESGPLISANRLVLVTAASPLAPEHTILVTAILQGTPQPSGAHGALSSDERTLVGDSGAALPLALWGQLLLVAVGLTVWLALTWRKIPTYLVATPVLIAVLWMVFENGARLLPNLL
jgi:sortase A